MRVFLVDKIVYVNLIYSCTLSRRLYVIRDEYLMICFDTVYHNKHFIW